MGIPTKFPCILYVGRGGMPMYIMRGICVGKKICANWVKGNFLVIDLSENGNSMSTFLGYPSNFLRARKKSTLSID